MKLYKIIIFLLFVGFIGCSDDDEVTSPERKVHNFKVEKNINWASPDGIDLTMDIYIPETGKQSYPVLVVFHGGGWLVNDNSVLSDFSEYISTHSEIIVCNVNYRLLGMNSNTTTMDELIEDAMGAVLWVKENIQNYKGDPSRIALTGDSAGGHLAAMVVIGSQNLSSSGFYGGNFGFNPSYLPQGKTAEQIASEKGLEVKALLLSYASLDVYLNCIYFFESPSNPFWNFAGVTARGIFGDTINVDENPDYYAAVSPNRNIPTLSERRLPPQLCMTGSMDVVVNPTSVKNYVNALINAGHLAEYWENIGKNHAYLQNGSNPLTGTNFTKDAPPAMDKMIDFMEIYLQ